MPQAWKAKVQNPRKEGGGLFNVPNPSYLSKALYYNMTFAFPLIWLWSPFLHPLESRLAHNLLCTMEYGGNDIM